LKEINGLVRVGAPDILALFGLERRVPEHKQPPAAGRTVLIHQGAWARDEAFDQFARVGDRGRAADEPGIGAIVMGYPQQAPR